MPDPTSKLTVHQIIRQLELIPDSQLPVTHEEIQQLVDHALGARRQAFEEAAEAVKRACGNRHQRHRFQCDYCSRSINAIRALAKEKHEA